MSGFTTIQQGTLRYLRQCMVFFGFIKFLDTEGMVQKYNKISQRKLKHPVFSNEKFSFLRNMPIFSIYLSLSSKSKTFEVTKHTVEVSPRYPTKNEFPPFMRIKHFWKLENCSSTALGGPFPWNQPGNSLKYN